MSHGLRERQKARWDAVDLPWGPGAAGLHALPFRNLRFIYITWYVFSWTPPSEHGLTNSYNWPSYQLAMLIKSNADTLDHVYIDEYPGFQLEKYGSRSIGDALLDLLAQNAPKLRSLSLGGLREPFYPHLHISKPQGSDDFLSGSPALYPSGEIIPHVMTDDNRLLENSSKSSLERLFIQGFDSESTILIEDAFLNRDVFSLGSLRYLALSLMPVNYNYAFILSKVQGSLTHLTLNLDKSTLHLNLKFSMFPQLECLQLRIYSIYHTWTNLFNIVRSLSDDMYSLDEPGLIPPVQQVKLLHVSLGPSIFVDVLLNYLIEASIDDMLKDLVSPPSVLSGSMGRPQVDMITMEIPETVLAKGLPLTFQTGHLKYGKTDQWWLWPVYLQ
ncbi:hypothetical protein J3R30DRAFT_3580257 [Lentinula aciculospora]|uniref:Uncharacterized protein n=1 Tax=Lentinula aciculospora TaxID=153920 RepID=A0A9W8ZUT0_9AGAR|nr:hypothetical protein J3R30DRAFT_3580257 [Lentinula aciculospora]